MKIVIQRVKSASVSIDGVIKGKINQGFLLLVGVEDADSNFDLDYAVRKIAQMRIFSDEADKMNLLCSRYSRRDLYNFSVYFV